MAGKSNLKKFKTISAADQFSRSAREAEDQADPGPAPPQGLLLFCHPHGNYAALGQLGGHLLREDPLATPGSEIWEHPLNL